MPGQSPPTTSGIVVLSGSNNFGPGSDFPVFSSISIDYHYNEQIFSPAADLVIGPTIPLPGVLKLNFLDTDEPTVDLQINVADPLTVNIDIPVLAIPNMHLDEDRAQTYLMFVGDAENTKITPADTTTSGIVVLDIFPGAGVADVPYVPPIFLNQRLFPVTFSGIGERVFPEENRRIYPVLPQFSIITPGG